MGSRCDIISRRSLARNAYTHAALQEVSRRQFCASTSELSQLLEYDGACEYVKTIAEATKAAQKAAKKANKSSKKKQKFA